MNSRLSICSPLPRSRRSASGQDWPGEPEGCLGSLLWLEVSPFAPVRNCLAQSGSAKDPHPRLARQRRREWQSGDQMCKLRVSPPEARTGEIFGPTAWTRHLVPQTRCRAATGCRPARALRFAVFTLSRCFRIQRVLKLREGLSGRVHLLCFLILALEEIKKIITFSSLKCLNTHTLN